MAVAVRAAGIARAHRADEPRGSVRSIRCVRERAHERARRWTGRQDLQPLGSQSGHGQGRLSAVARQDLSAARAAIRDLLNAGRHGNANLIRKVTMSPKLNRNTLAAAAGIAILGAIVILPVALRAQQQQPTHPVPAAKDGGTVVMLCDGKTSIEIKNLKPGQQATEQQGRAVANELMAKWQQQHPGEHWETAQAAALSPEANASPTAPAKSQPAAASGQQQGDTYASFTSRDYKVWQTETQKFVDEGKRVFH